MSTNAELDRGERVQVWFRHAGGEPPQSMRFVNQASLVESPWVPMVPGEFPDPDDDSDTPAVVDGLAVWVASTAAPAPHPVGTAVLVPGTYVCQSRWTDTSGQTIRLDPSTARLRVR